MSQFRLSASQRKDIVYRFQFGNYTQTKLAKQFGVSRKTIYRTLWAVGLVGVQRKTLTSDEIQILTLVKSHGISATSLQRALSMPILSPCSIRSALLNMSYEELTRYTGDVLRQKAIADVRLAEAQAEAQAEATRRQHQGEMEQGALV